MKNLLMLFTFCFLISCNEGTLFETDNLKSAKPTLQSESVILGGYCDSDFVDRDLYDVYPQISDNDYVEMNAPMLTAELTKRGIRFSGPGIIILLGGPACPFTECSGLSVIGDYRKKFYAITSTMPHLLDSYGGPFPVNLSYKNGSIIASQYHCITKSEAKSQYCPLKASYFGATLIDLSNIDLSTLPPGKYWIRYGVNGYGSPTGDQDAKLIVSRATCNGN